MRNAAIGGFLSGMGDFMGSSRNPVTFAPTTGLAQTNPLTNGELLKHGASKGVSGALEKYADFYIKRAEQMQPVIQVQAGRTVDIVVTEGVAFGGTAERGALVRINDHHRLQQIHYGDVSSRGGGQSMDQVEGQSAEQKPIDAWIPK